MEHHCLRTVGEKRRDWRAILVLLPFNTCWLEEEGRVEADGKGSGAGEGSRCLGGRSREVGEINPAPNLPGSGAPRFHP